MRCEIEEGLIEGDISVNELPKVWKKKMRNYWLCPNDCVNSHKL